jgi:pyridoxine 5-phosphate synthase
MTHLSVNVNKLATLRNSRGKDNPNVAALAQKILDYGAHGITVHPRPDERHIRAADVPVLRRLVQDYNGGRDQKSLIEFNVEGYPSEEFLRLVEKNLPHQATLVPDPPDAITSNAGWDLVANRDFLARVIERLNKSQIRVSLFVEPAKFDHAQEAALQALKPGCIELYTEAFADAFTRADREIVTRAYARLAKIAQDLGIGVNAGHDLSQANLGFLLRSVPQIKEVSIGHALICEALEEGLETTVKKYLAIVLRP